MEEALREAGVQFSMCGVTIPEDRMGDLSGGEAKG